MAPNPSSDPPQSTLSMSEDDPYGVRSRITEVRERDESQTQTGILTPEQYAQLNFTSRNAIVLDIGSYRVRAGYSCEAAPRLVYPPTVTKGREARREKIVGEGGEMEHLYDYSRKNFIGFEAYRPFARAAAKSVFEMDIMLNALFLERMLDETMVRLGLADAEEIKHPFVITEAVCNLNGVRANLLEILFEGYDLKTGVCLGIDSLFSYLYNSYQRSGELAFANPNALVVSASHAACHVLPVVNSRLLGTHSKRINVGGSHQTNTLMRRLQMLFPNHSSSLNSSKVETIKEACCATVPDLDYASFLNELRRDEEAFERAKYVLKLGSDIDGTSSPVLTAEEIERKKQIRAETGRRLFELMQQRRKQKQEEADNRDPEAAAKKKQALAEKSKKHLYSREELLMLERPLQEEYELEQMIELIGIIIRRREERAMEKDAAGDDTTPLEGFGKDDSATPGPNAGGADTPGAFGGASSPVPAVDSKPSLQESLSERLVYQAEDAFYIACAKRNCTNVEALKTEFARVAQSIQRVKNYLRDPAKIAAIEESFEKKKKEDVLLATADTQLNAEQLKEKRKIKGMRTANAVRDKMREQRDAEKQKLAEEHERKLRFREENPEGYLEEVKRERDELMQRMKRREAAKLAGSDRRSAASRNRMRLLVQQANDKESTQADTFGMNDSDWDVYRDMQGDNSEDEHEENLRLTALNAEIASMAPQLDIFRKPKGYGSVFFMPDNADEIPMVVDRFRTMEAVWQPSIVGVDQCGLAEAMSISVMGIPEDSSGSLRQSIVEEVFVTGGICNSPGFDQRVLNELRMALPWNWGIKTKIWKASNPSLDAWLGAALFAERGGDVFNNALISRDEYEEKGSEYLKEHLYSNTYVPSPEAADKARKKRKQ